VSAGRLPRRFGDAVLLALLPGAVVLGGCTNSVDGTPTPGRVPATPEAAAELEALLVAEVPSGLPRLRDDELDPPAGAKTVADIASYADDPERERQVLEDYGYRHGWERFWGHGTGPVTGVFVDQFERRAGAGAYAEDLAGNDAEHYRGMLRENPADLPGNCRTLTIDDPDPDLGLSGPAAFAWCGHGVFSIGVTAIAGSVDGAEAEMREVVRNQLDRLPPR
jgi:hypothetical protein